MFMRVVTVFRALMHLKLRVPILPGGFRNLAGEEVDQTARELRGLSALH
jgi:hypothetical protein